MMNQADPGGGAVVRYVKRVLRAARESGADWCVSRDLTY